MAFAAGSDKLRGAFREGVRYCDTRRETLSYAQICSRKGFQLFLLFILLFQFWGSIYGWLTTHTYIHNNLFLIIYTNEIPKIHDIFEEEKAHLACEWDRTWQSAVVDKGLPAKHHILTQEKK